MGTSFTVVFLALAAAAMTCATLCVQWQDNLLILSKEGLSLPGLLGGGLRRTIDREWSGLRKVSYALAGDAANKEPEKLILYFEQRPPLKIETQRLESKDLEQLVVAIEVWSPSTEGIEELALLKDKVRGGAKTRGDVSYTTLWEDEMSRRFSSTNFVPLEPGNMLENGRLKVIRQLGFGGLSAVYLVTDKDGNSFALKESVTPLNTLDVQKQKANELFAREARLLMKLSHPSIARVYDQFVENNRQYLLLEFVRGTNLRQLVIEKGPQEETLVMDWAAQIAEALVYIHSLNPPIIHRDVSPENILLKDDGRIMLVDFGAAKEFLGTATGTMIGKQCYVAPEQFRGRPVAQSDIYALCATMFFLLTGKDPLPLSSSSPWLAHKKVREELDTLIAQGTNQDALNRPPSANEFLSRLRAIERARPQGGRDGGR